MRTFNYQGKETILTTKEWELVMEGMGLDPFVDFDCPDQYVAMRMKDNTIAIHAIFNWPKAEAEEDVWFWVYGGKIHYEPPQPIKTDSRPLSVRVGPDESWREEMTRQNDFAQYAASCGY